MRAALCLAAFMFAVSTSTAQAVPDFSGTWTADADRVVVLRRVDLTPNGWGNMLEGLRRYRPYTVKITQSSGTLDIDFPPGANSFLKADAYALDGTKSIRVRDMGEYWRKLITQANWDGIALTLRSTHQVDWWNNAKPDEVVRQDTQIDAVFVLRLDQGGTQLVLETSLSDEKGQAQYRMVFTKSS